MTHEEQPGKAAFQMEYIRSRSLLANVSSSMRIML